MARIAGVDLPRNKRIEISLTYIYGVGRTKALEICEKAAGELEKTVAAFVLRKSAASKPEPGSV